MSLRLRDLLNYHEIVIQCHDNPDADALASGYALRWYLEQNGVKARFVYGGKFPLQKSNLVLMTDKLHIPVEYVTDLPKPELLVTVDCQYGESNVTPFEAGKVAVIDHHQVSGTLPEMAEIRSNYGACATVLYELITAEGMDINSDEDIATALYYGLMTDTNGFSEISHPVDRDLRDLAKFNATDIVLFKNSNLSREELQIAGDALNNAYYDDVHRFGIVEARPCDPNILGIISDMLLEVDSLDTCLVYSILPFGLKISVRSCVKEVKADELAGYLAEGYGGGGGHMVKAGGFLKRDLLEKAGIPYTPGAMKEFIYRRMLAYFRESIILYAGRQEEDISEYTKYRKIPVEVGYVEATKLAQPGDKIQIRTLEGDVDVDVTEDLCIIIGVDGEIYPCSRQKFEASYTTEEDGDPYVYPGEYSPAVMNTVTGERMLILPFAKKCMASGGLAIYARELDHRVKVFTSWDPDKYYLGKPGDFLAVREDDLKDIYIIEKNIFKKTYAEAQA